MPNKPAEPSPEVAPMRRIPSGPVCAKAGIWPYPCSGRLELQKDGSMKGSFLCAEHAFQAQVPAPTQQMCPDCKGMGAWAGTAPRGVCGMTVTECRTCSGTGYLPAVAPRETEPDMLLETMIAMGHPAAAPTPVEPPTCKWCKRPIRSINRMWQAWIGERWTSDCYYDKSPSMRHEPAAPAESQGVERAQPVEGPREFPCEECRKRDCGVRRPCECKNQLCPCVAAPVEGVERVTDDAPARVEPRDTCPMCEDYAKMVAAQPAKRTDDRPDDTIPEDLKKRYEAAKSYLERTQDENAWQECTWELRGSEAEAMEYIERTGRAETRIEVLEAALVRLRDCDWVISLPDRMDAVRAIARAALAAPSGETK